MYADREFIEAAIRDVEMAILLGSTEDVCRCGYNRGLTPTWSNVPRCFYCRKSLDLYARYAQDHGLFDEGG